MKIKNMTLALVLWSGRACADFKGIEAAMAVFEPEISFVAAWQDSIEKAGTLAPLIDAQLVIFIREHAAELIAEIPVLFNEVRTMYADSTVQKAMHADTKALLRFLQDPLLQETRSGSDIIALASYQEFKRVDIETKALERSFYTRSADKMPVIMKALRGMEAYNAVFFDRIETALRCLSWDDTLGAAINDMRDAYPLVDEVCAQFYLIVQQALGDQYVEQVLKNGAVFEQLAKEVVMCINDDALMRLIRAVRIVRSAKDQELNARLLPAFLQNEHVQKMVTIFDNIAQTMPLIEEK